MAENNNIKDFTAADIEKYWKGKLSTAEMHAIEKAAMDNPFLADALEGYKNTASATNDIKHLRQRLDKRTEKIATVISLPRKKYSLLKAAAAIIIICGIGLTVQQLVLKNRDKATIVNLENKDSNTSEAAVTNNQVKPDTIKNITTTPSSSLDQTETNAPKTLPTIISKQSLTTDTSKTDDRLATDIKREVNEKEITPGISAAAGAKRKEESLEEVALAKPQNDTSKFLNANKTRAFAKQAEADYYSNKDAGILNNKFNYRVVDAQNNPVPFANVMNTSDNVGTYTDVRGNFNLVSSDSILNVQIRSLGYNPANYKLLPSTQAGELVLKEDDYARKQILAQNRKVVSNVARKDSAELEEPEVGWGNYNTYIANNIQIPDNIRSKSTRSDVELSFDIDKAGNPINIKVTRSSQCKECDEEAKRLLKEGPKWKRKGKKSKTTISIAVD